MVRRKFIHQLVRGGMLAAMAAAAGILLTRNQITLGSDCSGNFQCRSCNKLKGCTLAEAQQIRDAYGEK
jgi:hypothetical protein